MGEKETGETPVLEGKVASLLIRGAKWVKSWDLGAERGRQGPC